MPPLKLSDTVGAALGVSTGLDGKETGVASAMGLGSVIFGGSGSFTSLGLGCAVFCGTGLGNSTGFSFSGGGVLGCSTGVGKVSITMGSAGCALAGCFAEKTIRPSTMSASIATAASADLVRANFTTYSTLFKFLSGKPDLRDTGKSTRIHDMHE